MYDDGEEGALRISRERLRQIQQEGWTPEGDDTLTDHELAWAAVCYAAPQRVYLPTKKFGPHDPVITLKDPWPERFRNMDKRPDTRRKMTPTKRIRALEKAGALIAAEIDRLLRLKRGETSDEGPKVSS